MPTRPYHPKDKAKVESAVLIVERWLLARLRNRTFFSLAEANEAIAGLLEELNQRPFKKLPGSRKEHFERYEKIALNPLPNMPYEFANIKSVSVRLDYHVEIENHYYSVPCLLIGKKVEYRLSAHTVELFHEGRRVASHPRSFTLGGTTSLSEHMPKSHQAHVYWSKERFFAWAQGVGISALKVAEWTIQNKPHPECCYRIHLGLQNLAKRYGAFKLEQACQYALLIASPSFKSIRSILRQQLINLPTPEQKDYHSKSHHNLRGSEYYRHLRRAAC